MYGHMMLPDNSGTYFTAMEKRNKADADLKDATKQTE